MIIVDADACPSKEEIIAVAREFGVTVLLVASYAHRMPEYENVIVRQADSVPEAVDIIIMNEVKPGDIVITQDYGLAAVVLGKKAKVLSPRGMLYTEQNMDGLLEARNFSAKIRRCGGRTKGPSPYTKADQIKLVQMLQELLAKHVINEKHKN